MNVILNGKPENVDISNLQDFIESKKIEIEGLVIIKNDEIIKKEDYIKNEIKEKDVIEILNFVAGG